MKLNKRTVLQDDMDYFYDLIEEMLARIACMNMLKRYGGD